MSINLFLKNSFTTIAIRNNSNDINSVPNSLNAIMLYSKDFCVESKSQIRDLNQNKIFILLFSFKSTHWFCCCLFGKKKIWVIYNTRLINMKRQLMSRILYAIVFTNHFYRTRHAGRQRYVFVFIHIKQNKYIYLWCHGREDIVLKKIIACFQKKKPNKHEF